MIPTVPLNSSREDLPIRENKTVVSKWGIREVKNYVVDTLKALCTKIKNFFSTIISSITSVLSSSIKPQKAPKSAFKFPPESDKEPITPSIKPKAPGDYQYKHEINYPTGKDIRNMSVEEQKKMKLEAEQARLKFLNKQYFSGQETTKPEDLEAIENAKKIANTNISKYID